MNQRFRHNDIGIVCLGNELHEKLFGYEPYELADLDKVRVRALEEKPELPDVELPDIPGLPYGAENIAEYFEIIAQRYFDKHNLDAKIEQLMSIDQDDLSCLKEHLPKLINECRAGVWTKLDVHGNLSESGELDTDAAVADTETFVKGSDCNSPIVGQAIGLDREGVPCLWMRLHPCFDEDIEYVPEKLSVGQNKLLIGHNFAFDRQKFLEAYSLKRSTNIYLCTMAMMKLVAGLDDGQKWAVDADPRTNFKASQIQEYGCGMSLVACYQFMTGKDLPPDPKAIRKIFVKAKTFQEFRDARYELLEYSMFDVLYNLELFQEAYPVFMEMSNHKAVLAGQSIVIDAVVPHIDGWDSWVDRCDLEYDKVERQVYKIVFPKLKEIHDKYLDSEIPEQLEPLNWDYVLPYRHRKDKPLPDGWDKRAKWFEKFRKGELSLKGRDLNVLMMAEYLYDGEWFDVYYTRKNAYHILVSGEVVKLPNRKNPGANYGNILSADSFFLAQEGRLRSKSFPDKFFRILELFDITTTYTGFRKRVIEQNRLNGLAAAEVNPVGTISGRTTSRLYNTLPAHWGDTPKIMSEIKMVSQCPEGYVFVGGDVDNQEATVAAAMGDSYYGASGACPFSAAVIVGTKERGTDFHSINAKNVTGKDQVSGEERFGAKGLGFGLIYGAGVSTTAKTIALAYGLSNEEALSKARTAVSGFKGEREYWNDKVFGKESKPFAPYEDGLASDVFNKMVDMIRETPHPKGLFFGNQWAKCLQPYYCGTDGSPPQLNYCIQASCSTYGFLSAWVLSIYDEIDRNGLDARFGISIHDETWWLSPEKQAEELAYWQMISYARCWALLNHNLFIEDMPLSRAFPSSISIDKILRKAPDASTKTPSFDESEPGREVTIYDYAEKNLTTGTPI